MSRLWFSAAAALIQEHNKETLKTKPNQTEAAVLTLVSKRITYYGVVVPLHPFLPWSLPRHSSATFSHQRTHLLPLRFA